MWESKRCVLPVGKLPVSGRTTGDDTSPNIAKGWTSDGIVVSVSRMLLSRSLCRLEKRRSVVLFASRARSPIRCSVCLDFVFVLDVILMSHDSLYLYCNRSTYITSQRRLHREIGSVSDCGKKRNTSSPTTSHNTIRRPLPPPGPSHRY